MCEGFRFMAGMVGLTQTMHAGACIRLIGFCITHFKA